MPEITQDRLMMLLGSAKANMHTSQVEIYHYEGAIQTLQLLIDDLRAQEIKEKHEQEDDEEKVFDAGKQTVSELEDDGGEIAYRPIGDVPINSDNVMRFKNIDIPERPEPPPGDKV